MLSADLFEENRGVAIACLESPFVRGLADGSLDRGRFRAYVAQDAFFLRAFSRAFALAAARSPDPESLGAFLDLTRGALDEMRLHGRYAESLGIDLADVRPADATLAYTDFLLATAWREGLGETVAAMAPCMRLYAWLGAELARDGVPDHAFADWIRTYSSPEFAGLAETTDRLLDRLAPDSAPVAAAYGKAMRLELQFFSAFDPPR